MKQLLRGLLDVVPKAWRGMTIRSKRVPTGSGNYYMYEQKSRRSGKTVQTDHVRYIGKGHHGGGQGPSQAVVPSGVKDKGTNPTFHPLRTLGGVDRFTAAPTRDPFPEVEDKRTTQGKNTVFFTQLEGRKDELTTQRRIAEQQNDLEGVHAKVIRDRGNWFYVETYSNARFTASEGGIVYGPLLNKDPSTGFKRKSDAFNKPIAASQAANVVPNQGSAKARATGVSGATQSNLPKPAKASVVPKAEPKPAKKARDPREGAIDTTFRVNSSDGARSA